MSSKRGEIADKLLRIGQDLFSVVDEVEQEWNEKERKHFAVELIMMRAMAATICSRYFEKAYEALPPGG